MNCLSPASAKNAGHYSPGVLSCGLLYISGQLSKDPATGAVASGSIGDHVRMALNNVEAVAQRAGLNRNDIIQCRIYITDIHAWDEVNEVFLEFFGTHKPARIVLSVPELHFGCKAEIEAIAECRKE